MKLSIIIPAYNEAATIAEIVRRVESVELKDLQDRPIAKEIIIVDDGSTDGTVAVLDDLERNRPDLRILRKARNQGKGAAVRDGFALATGDVLLIQDADLEYDPRDYRALLEPILLDRADVVYGSRFLGGPHRVHMFWHSVANTVLTYLSNITTNMIFTDMETCYKVFRAEVIRGLEIHSSRFGFEPEITAKVSRGGWRVYEVPVSYWGRSYNEGKKIGTRDALAAMWHIVNYGVLDRLRDGRRRKR